MTSPLIRLRANVRGQVWTQLKTSIDETERCSISVPYAIRVEIAEIVENHSELKEITFSQAVRAGNFSPFWNKGDDVR
jgi:hypothetical protein